MNNNPLIKKSAIPIKTITQGPRHHFFGYYDKRQFDLSGRFALGLACDIIGQHPEPEDVAELGMVDLKDDDKWIPLGKTNAWTWQFGCISQWLLGKPECIIYNDIYEKRFVSVIQNVQTRKREVLSCPVFDVSHDSRLALSLNFARLARLRPETGYRGVDDFGADDPAPANDGLFRFDLVSGKQELIFSLQELAERDPIPDMDGAEHYVTHPLWNKDDSRFLFWHRWKTGAHNPGRSRLYTANADGTNLYLLHQNHSHTTWQGLDKVLAWANTKKEGSHYYLFDDRADTHRIIGNEILVENGHFTFSPDGQWLLTDTPPDRNNDRAVLLYDWKSGECFEAGRFFSNPEVTGHNRCGQYRCDPHPRWHPDGRRICIDSVHCGSRQMYMLEVAEIVDG